MADTEARSDVRNLVSRWEPELSYRWMLGIYFSSVEMTVPQKKLP